MIDKKLKVGDYIFKANGALARITEIGKSTYTYVFITEPESYQKFNIVLSNGIKYINDFENEEWFVCDNVHAKALELAFKRYEIEKNHLASLEKNKALIANAKWFLEQISDIESKEPKEEEPA